MRDGMISDRQVACETALPHAGIQTRRAMTASQEVAAGRLASPLDDLKQKGKQAYHFFKENSL